MMQITRAILLMCGVVYAHVSCYNTAGLHPALVPRVAGASKRPAGRLALPLLPSATGTSRALTLRLSLDAEPQKSNNEPSPAPEARTLELLEPKASPVSEVNTLQLIKFILPTLAGWLSSEVMTVIDTAVVGSLGADKLAALSPATMLTDSSAYLFFWLSVATTSLFASSLAANDAEGAYDMLSDALWCAADAQRSPPAPERPL